MKATANLTLDKVREAYEGLSGKASDIVRSLSLAGIALIWLFKAGTPSSPVLEPALLKAAFFIFLALSLDLLQYLVGTFTWHSYFLKKEREKTPPDSKFNAPKWINWPTWTLFWLKAAAMFVAYSYILPFLYQKFIA
ncbi:MAG: hypothetical protein ABSE53_12480 [Terracidiphilus sp.]|jgi:hypothetical protein